MREKAGEAAPFGLFERKLAGRYLLATRHDVGVLVVSIIALLGILASVFVLITTMSVMNGFRETLLGRILGVNGHVYVDTAGRTAEERETLVRIARETPGVTHVAAIIEGQALAMVDGQIAGAFVRGISQGDLASLRIVSDNLVNGDLAGFRRDEDGAAGIVPGFRLAASLGAPPGGTMTLLSPQGAQTAFGSVPRRKTYTIAAAFNIGMQEYDELLVYMPLEEAQLFFNRGDSADRLELRIEDPDQSQAVMERLRARMPGDVYITDWVAQNQSLVGALIVERNVMRLILMMIVAIASLLIIASMVMLVKNKSRDIAILRTMGATRGAILRIFLMAGASLGAIGATAGLVLGVLFCIYIGPIQDFVSYLIGRPVFPGDVYSLSRLPAIVEWGEVASTAVFAFVMACVATLFPSWLAARLDPVEALRYE